MESDDDENSLSTLGRYGDLEQALYDNGRPVAMKLKQYMIQASFQRSTQVLPYYPYPGVGTNLPSTVNAIYNMAREEPIAN